MENTIRPEFQKACIANPRGSSTARSPACAKKLGCLPVRWHRNGTPFYTLPIIQDPLMGKIVGGSFDIAQYLDAAYPDGPRLPPRPPRRSTEVHRTFTAHVDKIFTDGIVILCSHGLPFNPQA
ncbi:hypothetical protein C8F04DRAFT_1259583 [Mycena alexandri]|uniref:GST N-terminal domain-containing protein n=1 Tax=Mycena alexandri TaxID=1745969 RepID=A0AAD6X457_9AGAR|nr:hypothetical protein C8F04DRAFT_1278912 [Mycena alexandri]KAJ7034910.1 hypothetical protein C8F04DRAFT_1259583 [Mycena alexandri]